MIYKVLYQEDTDSAPVREKTKSLYVEASSEREVRSKLSDRHINIEYIQLLEGKHLEHEQKSSNYELENI